MMEVTLMQVHPMLLLELTKFHTPRSAFAPFCLLHHDLSHLFHLWFADHCLPKTVGKSVELHHHLTGPQSRRHNCTDLMPCAVHVLHQESGFVSVECRHSVPSLLGVTLFMHVSARAKSNKPVKRLYRNCIAARFAIRATALGA